MLKINKKIVFSLIFSFFISYLIINLFYFNNQSPKINKEKISRNILYLRNNLTIFTNKIKYNFFTKEKINYNQHLANNDEKSNYSFYLTPYPTIIVKNNFIIKPTIIINNEKLTNIIINNNLLNITPTKTIMTSTSINTNESNTSKKEPTAYITEKIKPTEEITKIIDKINNNIIKIENPFSQPYYNPSKAYLCYNNEKFIEIYAENVKPDKCYQNIKNIIEKNLVNIKILDKTITIHQKTYNQFKAVADELEKNQKAKNYKINTIGAYVFRCNVNATKGDKFDTCNPDCKLSAHSFGIAIDINWEENCNGCEKYTMPIEIVEIFEKYGFRWGGRYKQIFNSTIDPMHFEYMYDLCKDVK